MIKKDVLFIAIIMIMLAVSAVAVYHATTVMSYDTIIQIQINTGNNDTLPDVETLFPVQEYPNPMWALLALVVCGLIGIYFVLRKDFGTPPQ